MRKNRLQTRRSWLTKKKITILAVLVCLIAGTLIGLEKTDTTHLFHSGNRDYVTQKPSSNRTANSDTKGETSKDNSSASQQPASDTTNPEQNKDKDSDTSTAPSGAELKDPSGNFVSNHHPNLSGSPAPNEIQSVCVTTSGAYCEIVFTKDGVTKSLPKQLTDRGGASYWTWKLQDIGLTKGSWKIQAKATLGSQTKTADDAATLEVNE
jgi:hypothetical protein